MREPLILKSEFAQVSVQVDHGANGVRLMIQDMRSGKVSYLDPLEIECLVWCKHEELVPLLNPSLTRWKQEDH